jgi:hypothetical protein
MKKYLLVVIFSAFILLSEFILEKSIKDIQRNDDNIVRHWCNLPIGGF